MYSKLFIQVPESILFVPQKGHNGSSHTVSWKDSSSDEIWVLHQTVHLKQPLKHKISSAQQEMYCLKFETIEGYITKLEFGIGKTIYEHVLCGVANLHLHWDPSYPD